ncbi:hypothetical protein GGR56DRAFT_200214 [Xylariaceae sp. FL0804]|nr:hypothetical protein GGR56DRAFT_200214 [Xylariaceae sp. FL0804]
MASGPVAPKAAAAAADSTSTPSMDPAVSANTSRSNSQTESQDAGAQVAHLISAAGSPEAVIQYLLKEKHSQSQQNSQLWRLVDKQRAMILGLNKDLERALKDKEKYRKKLKEVISVHDDQVKRDTLQMAAALPRVDITAAKNAHVDVPASPPSNLDSDSVKESPVDMSLAPYPITPPADQVTNEPLSAVGDLLDPSHVMPKASEHAVDNFDHDQEDQVDLEARKVADASHDLPIHLNLPPSRSLPSEPPRMPAPKPPSGPPPPAALVPQAASSIEPGISSFPPPSAPPPRKPPPAPLQLKKDTNMTAIVPPEEDNDSSSDYDSLLEVDEIPIPESRGRRRTREEDDRERVELAMKEAEARSLSKKSKKGSQKGTPKSTDGEHPAADIPASPRTMPAQPMLSHDSVTASLAGVLSGSEPSQHVLAPPLKSPGLPASPRPMMPKSPLNSPPLSPRAIPLSPRAPRQPIPLPANTPNASASAVEPLHLSSPKPLNILKEEIGAKSSSPTGSRDSPVERNKIYKGFVTDEYPDLLLAPNALPSIVVKVASSRMKPSRASMLSLTQLEEDPVFTLAINSRSDGSELWRVEKDTASFVRLDQKMKQCAAFTAKTPDRSLFSGHAPAKLDARRTVLDQYMEELLNTPLDIVTALEFCSYLSSNTLPPNIDDSAPTEDPAVETVKKGPGGRPFRNGYLTKRGKNFGGWKARYFVLDGPLLKYYEAPGGAHLGTIKLQNAQIGKQSQQANDGSPGRGPNGDELDNQYRHAFLVLEPKKKDSTSHVKHVLCAESDRERDQWVDALLRWIDYRDPSDEDANRSTTDRQGPGHSTGASAKKRPQGHSRPQASRNDSDDALIGMSYDSAKQGDAPDGAPPRRRVTTSPDPLERSAAPSKTISAPRDPQLISDMASWGKPALAPPGPTYEEKKARKRSFFGFGPKTRSLSEDQDPLYGSGGGNVPQGQGEYRGPVKQVFGAPLAEAARYNGPVDVDVPLPSVVYRCIEYLEAKNAIFEEGIFRLSGSNIVIKQLRERFNTEGDVNLLTDETYYDIHAVASLLKLYLRELPSTILTRELHMKFAGVTEMTQHREKIVALAELAQRLPLVNETLLKYLIAFLVKIINHADRNKMTVRNVGIVFSPTLNIPAPVFALLLQNYDGVFGLSPEEYELPMASREPPLEPAPRRPSSSSGAAASPQRQRMIREQAHQRSTPTPPPVLMPGGLRPAVTAPQYLAQPGASAPAAPLRPAYEGGFNLPAGYEPNMMPNMMPPPPVARQPQQPTYDRPHYASPYDQDFGGGALPPSTTTSKAKRRESSMFMMNNMLGQQSSNSRLREETRM